MAKQPKPTDRTRPKTVEPVVSVVSHGDVRMESSDAFLEQAEAVRRLAHRAVDLIVDSGCHKLLSASVIDSLAFITWNENVKHIADFVQRASPKQAEVCRG